MVACDYNAAEAVEPIICVDDDVPHLVIGDQKRLSQMLLYVLSNAFKFTDIGSVTVHVSLLGQTVGTHMSILSGLL
jgi:signal transduction histidine kinase